MKKILSLAVAVALMLQVVLCCGVVFAADAPQVVSVTPSGTNLQKASSGAVTFDVPMNKATLTSANIVIKNTTDNIVVTPVKTAAYDDKFVFVCDFEANKSYSITVGTGVKSAENVALAEAETHTFSTDVFFYGVEEITPQADSSYQTNFTASADGTAAPSISSLYDNNKATGMRIYGAGGYITVDLGAPTPLAYIQFITAAGNTDSKGINLKVSNDSTFAEENTVLLATTPDTASIGTTWIGTAGSEAYQYVRIDKSDIRLGISEIDIYGYKEPAAPTVTLITPEESDNVTKAAMCKVVFDQPMMRSTLNSNNIVVKDVTNDNVTKAHQEFFAYDNQYVFRCTFEPNIEYSINISTNVKAANGIALAEPVTHTFKMGEVIPKYVDATPKTDSSYSTNFTTGSVSSLYDGVASSQSEMIIYGTTPAEGFAHITVDLGMAKELAYIKCTTGSNGSASGNIQIQVSNDPNFAENNTVELAVSPTTEIYGYSGLLASTDDSTPYRYIRFRKVNNCRIADINVYAYPLFTEEIPVDEEAEPSEYTVNSYTAWGSLEAGADVIFDAAITLNGEYAMPKVYAAVYSEVADGVKTMVAFNESAQDATSVKLAIPLDATNASVKFFIMSDELIPLIASIEKTID